MSMEEVTFVMVADFGWKHWVAVVKNMARKGCRIKSRNQYCSIVLADLSSHLPHILIITGMVW